MAELRGEMTNKVADLWSYVTGAVDGPLAATGGGVRAAIERWRELVGSNSVDFEAEGLLAGADDSDGRKDLLEQLHAAGIPLDELRAAVEQDRLALLPVEGVLKATGEHTVAEMAAEAGLDRQVIAQRLQALGIGRPGPDTVLHDDALAAARALRELEDSGMPVEGIDDICRTVGRAMNATANGVRDVAGRAYIETGDSERDLGLRYAAAARRMIPVLTPLLEFALTMHLLRLVRSDVVSRAERMAGDLPTGRDVAVAFADLADFTQLGESMPPEDVGDLVRRFERLVQERTPPAAQHVKTVGDAAMIVADDVDAVVEACIELIRATADGHCELPAIHAGVAFGRAVTREGDWHGSPVNMASRLADAAPAGRIFATDAVRDACTEIRGWTDVGTYGVKGIDGPVHVSCLAPNPTE